jgi:hypothetical protein
MALSAFGMAGGPTGYPNNMAGGVNPRDRITQALMQIQNPPPPMNGAPSAGATQFNSTALGSPGEPTSMPQNNANPIPAPQPMGAAPAPGVPTPPAPTYGGGNAFGMGGPLLPQMPNGAPNMMNPLPYGS